MNANQMIARSNSFSFGSSAIFLSAVDLAVSPVRQLAALVATWQQRIADRRQLCGLNDHTLRDVGLSRGDVEFEASKPFWRS